MKTPRILAASLFFGAIFLAGATAARPALRDVPEVTEGLISAAIAWEIGDKCDGIDARILRGIGFLNGLKSTAREMGYSRSEIDSFVNSEVEKDRLEAIARQRLRDLGGVEGRWDTYCTVGRSQIAAGSQIGQLLR